MGNNCNHRAMKTILNLLKIAILAKLNSAFTISENEAKVMLKLSKPLSSIMDNVVQKRDNWWESNFRNSNLERECVEEDCYLEEYIESAENNLHNLLPAGVKGFDIRKTVDPESQWYDRRVKAYFDHHYTNCLPVAISMDAVRLCLNMADDSLSRVFMDPKLPGEEQRPIFENGTISEEDVEKTTQMEDVETTSQIVTTTKQSETIINVEELNNIESKTGTETTTMSDLDFSTSNETSESFDNERNARIDLDIEAVTTESITSETAPVELVTETTAEMYNIVTFGINPDGSLYYDKVDRKTEPSDKNSQLSELVSAFEEVDTDGPIENIFS